MRCTSGYEKLNDSQRHALDTQRNLAVRAGAGSGKTTVLVERTLQLLARHYDAGQPLELTRFAIVTFTRKAAAELQERLSEGCQALAEAAATPAERHWWRQRIDELPRAAIGTIDSQCAGILREFAFLAPGEPRLEPDFAPLEGYDADLLQREAIDRVINRLLAPSSPLSAQEEREQESQAEAVRWWTSTHGFPTLIGHLLSLLNHNVEPEMIIAAYAELPSPTERVQQLERLHPGVRRLREDRRLAERIQRLRAELGDMDSAAVTHGKLCAAAGSLLLALRSLESDERTILTGLAELLLNKDGSKSKFQSMKGLPAVLYELQDEWYDALSVPLVDGAAEIAAGEAADRLVRLLAPVQAEYLALCQQAGQYDFTTIARRTRDLLRGSAAVRREMQERFRHVLVDEFQDTNFLQWEIISWLVGEGPEGGLDRDRLFIVGDPQQSIYRFRQADVRVFQRVQERIRECNQADGHAKRLTDYEQLQQPASAAPRAASAEQRLGLMPLKENYRSLHPAPLELLNRVFRHVFDKEQHGRDPANHPFETVYQELLAGRIAEPAGEVCYLVPPGDPDEPEMEEVESEENGRHAMLSPAQVRAVVRELMALHGQPRLGELRDLKKDLPTLTWGDMAVLLPSRTDVLTALETEFRARGVPFVTSKGIGFWQRQEVRDVVSLARWLGDPGDELSLFAVLRSPLGQLLDTHILFLSQLDFFLSQLGFGSIRRGLRVLKDFDDALVPRPEAEKTHEHWQRLPEPVRDALSEVWARFATAERERIRRTAKLLERWRQRVERMAQADLLQSCLEDGGAYAIYAAEPDGELILGNLARVMEQVRALESNHATGLARLARRLDDLVDGSTREEQAPLAPGQDAVQIMTVHAAKGLQFPVVAVMRMERKIGAPDQLRLHVWPAHGELLPADRANLPAYPPGVVAVQIRHPERPREWYRSRVFRALEDLDEAQELAEARRLFYVAATRVEERLLLVGKEPRPKKDGEPGRPQLSWQRWLEEALGIGPEHKQRGLWQDATGLLRMRIVTDASPATPLPRAEVEAELPAVDLEYIHELPFKRILPATGPAGFLALLSDWQADRRSWWVRRRVNVLPHCPKPRALDSAELDRECVGSAIGTLVHRLFQMRLSKERSVTPLLRSMAQNALSSPAATGDGAEAFSPRQPAVDAVVAGVRQILAKLESGSADAREVRALLEAPGECETPFALDLGAWRVNGRFDKLCRALDGVELVDWKTDEADDRAGVATQHRAQLLLYALALWCTGRASLAANRMTVRLVLLHEPCAAPLVFHVDELLQYEQRVRSELADMDTALRASTPLQVKPS